MKAFGFLKVIIPSTKKMNQKTRLTTPKQPESDYWYNDRSWLIITHILGNPA